jgi:geranylgeranyl diphosphate synthase type II
MKTSSGERSLKAYLNERREAVDVALGRFLPDASTPPRTLHEAMRYSVFSGGKRLRPILAVTAFELAGGEGDAILAPAIATEFIHTYSLIHDDLPAMDDDDTRRGRPTCHRAFDEATAILAGDALLTLAFEIVAREERITPERRLSIVAELAAANGLAGMVGGQVADMEGEGAAVTLEAVEFIHLNKTARPLKAAVLVGALAAGAPSDDVALLSSFGERMGLAFQIADDLLDVTGSEEEMGKAVGKDEGRGKLTYPAAVGVSGAAARAKELTDEALAALDAFGDRAWALREIARFVVARRN